MTKDNKPTIFSGVQPSGTLHIGNYLGAISNWVDLQDKYNSIFCVVDYHAITVKQDPKELNKNILDVVKIYMASGINPEKAVIFQQSNISAHTELAWILNCTARMSDLFKMTQFKDKTKVDLEKIIEEIEKRTLKTFGNSETYIISSEVKKLVKELSNSLNNVRKSGIGLFDYPVLMASDILLYNTDLVPVGEDQKQHVELARTLARRFNSQFGKVFRIPEVEIKKEGARIMGLDDPTKKMSKSASPANYIALTDSPEVATKKIMKAVTDSDNEIKYDQKKKPAISNLLTIYSLLIGEDIKKVESKCECECKGYGDFKKRSEERRVGKECRSRWSPYH